MDNFLSNYPESDIIVDTNNDHSERLVLEKFGKSPRLKVFVHREMDHPFHLAWMHRGHFKRHLDSYDTFLYTEDDMWIPRENYLNYLEVFDLLWPRFIPSFIRTEEKDGNLYCADAFIRTRVREKDVIKMAGRRFVTLDNPYHAFWIMPRGALKNSMNENFERIHEGNKWIREIAASYGLMPGKRQCVRWESYDIQKIGLVEVDERMRVSSLCHSRHTTDKYINDPGFNFGKIHIDKLIKRDAILI
jgi:hypothetical protein